MTGGGDPAEGDPYARLAALGLTLPPPRPPVANFCRGVATDGLMYLSGQGPVTVEGLRRAGKVGAEVDLVQAREHARLTMLNLLAASACELGSLHPIRRIVRVFGMVNVAPGFADLSAVMDGASALLVDVFGPERGRHARTDVGLAALPGGITVEIEMVIACAR